MSAIEKELQKATGVKPKKGEPRSKYLDRLSDEADKMDDADFEKLTEDAQEWVSAASAEVEKAKDRGVDAKIKDFKSSKEPDEGAEDDQEDATSGTPAGETEEEEVSTKKGKAAKAPKAAKTNGSTKAPAKAAKAKEAKAEGYKGHRAGSNKEQAHKLYDELGADKARPKAEKLGVKASTIGAWFSSWNTKKGEKRASK